MISRTPDRSSADVSALAESGKETRSPSRLRTAVASWEAPIDHAVQITRRTLAWFPIRVWRHFLQNNGFLLAAGVSYQALFSMFALIYVAFAGAGLWLGGTPTAIERLIRVINEYLPGLIAEDGGLFTTAQVTQIAQQSVSVLAVTGSAALLAAVWTSIGFITFSRRAVRDIFAVPPDRRNFLLLKTRDFLASLVFAALLLVGSALASTGTWAIGLVFELFSWDTESAWYALAIRLGAIAVSFAVFSIAVGVLMRFLVGIALPVHRILPGALLGGGALTVLQLGAGWLLSYTPANPLLATFAIFVGLLLWFRLVGIVLLVASSWVAVAARDDDERLLPLTPEERRAERFRDDLEDAQRRLRDAVEAQRAAPWWRQARLRRETRDAWDALAALIEDVPDAAPAPLAGPLPSADRGRRASQPKP